MAEREAGSLFVTVKANVSNFMAGMAASDKRLRQFHNTASKWGRRGALVLGAGLAYSFREAMRLEQQLAITGAVADQVGKNDLRRLRVQAMSMGQSMRYGAQGSLKVASAQTELARAGLKTADILGGALANSLDLANAGSIDAGEGARYIANAMQLFNIKAKNSAKIADAFAMAANRTTADITDFGRAMSQGGSVAKIAGLSFKDTMVTLEALARIGIKNSDAGTSMKAAFLQLLTPTKKQAETQKKLGLELTTSNGHLKNAVQLSDELRKATGHMTAAERAKNFSIIAGQDGIRTLNALYTLGPKIIAAYSKELGQSGTAAETARKATDNSAVKFKAFMETLKNTGIMIATALLPAFLDLAQGAQKFLLSLQGNTEFKQFLSDLKTSAVSAIQAFINVIKMGAPVIHAFAEAFKFLTTTSSGNAILGMTVGIYAVVKALRVAQVAVTAFKASWISTPWGAIATGLFMIGGALVGFLANTRNAVTAQQMLAAATGQATAAVRGFKTALDSMSSTSFDAAQAQINLTQAQITHRRVQKQVRDGTLKGAEANVALRQSSLDVSRAQAEVKRTAQAAGKAQKEGTAAIREKIKQADFESNVARQNVRDTQSLLARQQALGASDERVAKTKKVLTSQIETLSTKMKATDSRYRAQINYLKQYGKSAGLSKAQIAANVAQLERLRAAAQKSSIKTIGGALQQMGAKGRAAAGGLQAVANNASEAAGQVQSLAAQIAGLSDKTVTITLKTVGALPPTGGGGGGGGGGRGGRQEREGAFHKEIDRNRVMTIKQLLHYTTYLTNNLPDLTSAWRDANSQLQEFDLNVVGLIGENGKLIGTIQQLGQNATTLDGLSSRIENLRDKWNETNDKIKKNKDAISETEAKYKRLDGKPLENAKAKVKKLTDENKGLNTTLKGTETTLRGSVSKAGGLRDKLFRAKTAADAFNKAMSSGSAAFERSWDRAVNEVMRAFDQETDRQLDDIRAKFDGSFKQVDVFRDTLTPMEQLVKDMEDSRAQRDLEQAVTRAEKSLAEAQSTGTSDDVLQAQQDLNDARQDLALAGLRKQADAERKQRDEDADAQRDALEKSLAGEELKRQTARDIERDNLQSHLDDLRDKYLSGKATIVQINEELMGALAAQAGGFEQSGIILGKAWTDGIQKAIGDSETAAKNIAKAVAKYLKLKSPAEKGPLSDLDTWWTAFPDTLLSGVDSSGLGPAMTNGLGAARTGSSGSTTITVIVQDRTTFGVGKAQLNDIARQLKPALERVSTIG